MRGANPAQPFQFPSNGKAYPKEVVEKTKDTAEKVSIPFKREGISKDYADRGTLDLDIAFQFPSNGKAYPKLPVEGFGLDVSAVFQFPSNGKAYPKKSRYTMCAKRWTRSFNSLQTGRHIQSFTGSATRRTRGDLVSIPFKREGISKGSLMARSLVSPPSRFNSLQTGRHIQRNNGTDGHHQRGTFQFPSNGKAYPKRNLSPSSNSSLCFNSLQTGRHIQSNFLRPH